MVKLEYDRHDITHLDLERDVFSMETLQWIDRHNLWNLWVPESFGGLEMSLSEGLNRLFALAKIDGSLGWTVTLCSGANFFIGNLREDIAGTIFNKAKSPVRFGGSGSASGAAEKRDDGFIISGKWKYATGAPYLTHFTLNAELNMGGETLRDAQGSPLVRSFLIDRQDVEIIEDWNAMGLKATATHSFRVKSKWVPEAHSFIYDRYFHDHPIFKVPFSNFADLTLWVNYLGMASHFLEEARKVLPEKELLSLGTLIDESMERVKDHAARIASQIERKNKVSKEDQSNVHKEAVLSVARLSQGIINIYPLLGIIACDEVHVLNHIFKDYFTATQHHIFH